MNKEQEKYLFTQFQKNFIDMPSGIVEFDDAPDVIVTLPTGVTIGIEMTECIYNEDLMRESEFQIKFTEKVIAQLEGVIPFTFHLDVDLDKNKPLKQNQIKSTIEAIVEICALEFGDLQNHQSKDIEQLDVNWNEAPPHIRQIFLDKGYRKLPKGITRIHMTRFDILEKSNHTSSKGGVVPNFTQTDLTNILQKKENALKKYKSCHQQWLVIGEARDFYSYINNLEIEPGFETKFDKIFMYRRWQSLVAVLK